MTKKETELILKALKDLNQTLLNSLSNYHTAIVEMITDAEKEKQAQLKDLLKTVNKLK